MGHKSWSPPLSEDSELHSCRVILLKHLRFKALQSSDGDIIDCVLLHHQPAFDHPRLRGHKPLDPPERPRGHNKRRGLRPKSFQLWRMEGGACPEEHFGKKLKHFKRDTSSNGHEVSLSILVEEYGAKASINVWAPQVQNQYEFSLSQIWIISGSFGNDLNTIEAGWQVSPELYGDNYPRFFTYWTNDAYQATGCYNLLCSGFVQTNSQVAIGAAISPSSSFKGGQFDITLLIWKVQLRYYPSNHTLIATFIHSLI
ncbi:BnaC08g14520D [Brassica napus]|uniref:BnaC08g14520D protein n=1 Tax=Brassica napus TaxID=3708 RepID=A0A078G594_BRANA|nr:BnaC08g14520D [Brassica napus]